MALTSSPKLRELYYELGRALSDHGRHSEAVAALEQSLHEEGESPRVVLVSTALASARRAAGDVNGAFGSVLDALLQASPDEVEAPLELAEEVVSTAQLPAHRRLLCDRRWHALLSRSSPLHATWPATRARIGALVGNALLELDEPGEAKELLGTIATLPNDPTVVHLYGRALERVGEHQEAVIAFDKACQAARVSGRVAQLIEISVERAYALLATGDVDGALASLPDPLPTDERLRAQALALRALALLAKGELDAALNDAEQASALLTDDLDILRVKSRILLAAHRHRDALQVIEHGIDLNPTDQDLQLRRLLVELEGQEGLDLTAGWERRFHRFDRPVIEACAAEGEWRGRDDDGRAHFVRAVLAWVLGDPQQTADECRRALELGLGADLPAQPDTPVNALLAQCLETLGDADAAVDPHFVAGYGLYLRNELASAVTHLEYVIERRPDHPRASWVLADALDLESQAFVDGAARSDGQTLLEAQAPLLRRAQAVWDQAAQAIPNQIEPWAYGVRALINEHSVSLQPERREELLWGGIVLIERGLVRDLQNQFLWTNLGRLCRLQKLYGASRAANEKSRDVGPADDAYSLEERVILLGNTGDFEGALAAIELQDEYMKARDASELNRWTPWQLAVRAYVAEGLGNYRDALEVLRSVSSNDRQRWVIETEGRVLRMLGRRDESQRVYADLLGRPDDDPDWTLGVANAHFALGRPDEAIESYERWRSATGAPAEDVEAEIGLCHLLRGDMDTGRKYIETRIARGFDFNDFGQLRYGLRVIAEERRKGTDDTAFEDVSASLLTLGQQAARATAQATPDPDAELSAVLAKSSPGDDARAAAIAGLARRSGERGDWETAVDWYAQLVDLVHVFPEIDQALAAVSTELTDVISERLDDDDVPGAVRAADAIAAAGRAANEPNAEISTLRRDLGDELVRRGHAESAREQYSIALDLVDQDDLETIAAMHGRLFISSGLDGGAPSAEHLSDVIRLFAAAEVETPGRQLGELACSLIEGVGPYRRLDSAWARIYDDTGDAPELRAELSEARMALVGALEDALGMSGAAEDQLPIVTPLVLELGSAVVPLVDPAQDNGHFLDELVPAMRDRIASTTGVTVPGVRARVNEALKPVEFSIQVDETPVSTTTLNPEGTYVVSRDNPPDGWFTDVHPLTGQRGVWTIRERSPGDDGAGEVLTAADVLIHHIERVVRENLRRYLGPEEVSGLVAGWKESEPDLVAATLPEPDDELRLTWLLQDMVDDLIPLTDGPAILNGIIAANGLRTPTRSLHRVLRSNFAHWLPGPAEGLTAVSILAEHDAALSEGTAPIVELEFRQWLHESVNDLGPNLAIVAANADARERADIWARAEHPLIRTLTTDELSLQAAVSRPAESVAER